MYSVKEEEQQQQNTIANTNANNNSNRVDCTVRYGVADGRTGRAN